MITIVDKRLIPSETITLKTSNIFLGLWSSWLARRVVSAKVAGSSPAYPVRKSETDLSRQPHKLEIVGSTPISEIFAGVAQRYSSRFVIYLSWVRLLPPALDLNADCDGYFEYLVIHFPVTETRLVRIQQYKTPLRLYLRFYGSQGKLVEPPPFQGGGMSSNLVRTKRQSFILRRHNQECDGVLKKQCPT